MQSNGAVLALWPVKGENLDQMEQEAQSDAVSFIGPDSHLNVILCHCSPLKIEGGRIESWIGWAVISWGYVEPELLLNTIKAQRDYSLQQAQLAGQQLPRLL